MTHVKICGVKRVEDAKAAALAGAGFLGFVFAPSKRRITPEQAREIIGALRAEGHDVKAVGVFVDETPEEMNRIAAFCGLDYVQLSGNEPEETAEQLHVPVIRALHVRPEDTPETLRERIRAARGDILLLDTARAGQFGGTGQTFDWTLVTGLDRPFLLAGGLHDANVREAIAAVRAWGVDVSSGVETEGEKDREKIARFVAAARGRSAG